MTFAFPCVIINLITNEEGETLKTQIKIRLLKLGKNQTDLIPALRERYGEKIHQSELSRIIGEVQQDKKATRILDEIDDIISDWEKLI